MLLHSLMPRIHNYIVCTGHKGVGTRTDSNRIVTPEIYSKSVFFKISTFLGQGWQTQLRYLNDFIFCLLKINMVDIFIHILNIL